MRYLNKSNLLFVVLIILLLINSIPLKFSIFSNKRFNESPFLAQNEDYLKDWERSLSGYYSDIDVDNYGAIYTAGASGGLDFNLTKFYPNGTISWTRTQNKDLIDDAGGVAVYNDYVYYSGWSAPGSTNQGGTIWLFKYNISGDFEWQRSFGSNGRVYDLEVDDEGSVYIIGCTWELGALGMDALIVKFDSFGTQQWVRLSGNSGNDDANAGKYASSTGTLFFTGDSESSGNMLLLHYTKSGSQVLNKEWDNGDVETGEDIAISTIDSKVYVVGDLGYAMVAFDLTGVNVANISGFDQKSISIDSEGDIVVARYSIQGSSSWYTIFSSTGTQLYEHYISDDIPMGAVFDNEGNLFTIGHYGTLDKFIIDTIAPIITIYSPIKNEQFGKSPPPLSISFNDPNLYQRWYNLENDTYITANHTGGSFIDQEVWDEVGNGNVTINFYANDTMGNLGSNSIQVYKNTSLTFWFNLTGSPILITSDSSWNFRATHEPWCRGLGTIEYPYIIENVYIEGTGAGNLIEIRDTSAYYILKNITLINGGNGIYLQSSDNGMFDDIKCNNQASNGLYLRYSDNLKILNSKINSCIDNGVYVYYCSNIEITNSSFMDHDISINQRSTNNLNVTSNQCFRSYYGIYGEFGENISICDNDIINSTNSGIYFEDSTHLNITENYIDDSVYNGIGIYDIYNAQIERNTVLKSETGIFTSGNGGGNNIILNNNISSNNDGIFAFGSHTDIINNTILSNNLKGVYLLNYHRIVSGNNISKNKKEGIYIEDSSLCNISSNTIFDNWYSGIYVESSHNLLILNNTIDNNGRDGIFCETSFQINIKANKLSNNYYSGLRLDGLYYSVFCNDFNITDNFIGFNNYYGIALYECDNNTITGNTIIGNRMIWIYFYGIDSGNKVHDNFIDDRFERNDFFSTAAVLNGYPYYNSHYYYDTLISNNDDWYTFETGQLFAINIEIFSNFSLYFELYSNDSVLLAQNNTGISNLIHYEPDYHGIFYLRIYGGFNVSYAMNISVSLIESPPNGDNPDNPPDNPPNNFIPGFSPVIIVCSLFGVSGVLILITKSKKYKLL